MCVIHISTKLLVVNMSLKELYPTYPFILTSPRGSKIKVGTRRIYVDLPWQSYYFLQVAMNTGLSTTEEVREEWHKFLQNNNHSLVFHGEPLVSASLRTNKFSERAILRLDVKWDLFVEYLEENATDLLSEIEKGEENIMNVYREILINLFSIIGIRPINPQNFLYTRERERFRKLLRRTGDYSYIKNLLAQLEEIMSQVEKRTINKIPSIQLYTTNLIMDIQHLGALIDVVDIPAAYLLLRNLLENFVKLFVYLDIGKSINYPEVILSTMFLYEYETSDLKKRRVYSLKEFRNNSIRISKIISLFPHEEELDVLVFINKLKEKQIPTLGINRDVLREFSENKGLNVNLDMLYSACSDVIHNQPPLPFFSLLEVKFFKHFLEKYIQSLHVIAEKLVDGKIELEKVQIFPQNNDQQSLKKCLQVADFLERKYDAEIKDMMKRTLITLQKEESGIWVEPLTLISFFHLISPSLRHLRSFSFIEEDLNDIIEKLSPTSFKGSIQDEVSMTLSKFQEVLLQNLKNYEVFSSLNTLEQKKVIFYLLLCHLPEITEEIVES